MVSIVFRTTWIRPSKLGTNYNNNYKWRNGMVFPRFNNIKLSEMVVNCLTEIFREGNRYFYILFVLVVESMWDDTWYNCCVCIFFKRYGICTCIFLFLDLVFILVLSQDNCPIAFQRSYRSNTMCSHTSYISVNQ